MNMLSHMEKISQKYAVSPEEFIRSGAILNLKEKKRLLRMERIEILSRYSASDSEELKQKISKGIVSEHPGWEDLIELENIEYEIADIEGDIKSLQ
jgi:hypothetical protein